MSKEPRTFQYPFGPMPVLDGAPSLYPLRVNAEGQVIFDEASLAILDEHIRKVVREEYQRMINEMRMRMGVGEMI